MRHLVVVLGDQLDLDSSAFDGLDPTQDAVWMAEVLEESTHVPSAKARSVLFLSAMRHFAQELQALGRPLHYTRLNSPGNMQSLDGELQAALSRLQPQALVLCAPGDWRVLQSLRAVAQAADCPLQLRDDRHFFSTVRDFSAHAQGRKQLRMEYWYREQRCRHQVLMNGDEPAGGQWNFDASNRQSFGRRGPGKVPAPPRFAPDAITKDVIALVQARLPQHPGDLASFAWPVTRAQALQALQAFIDTRLAEFGRSQDALWPGQPTLWHSLLASSLNLKLLSAREVVAAAEAAWRAGRVPIESAEGFIRQILGWREYVRGIYWTQMPDYLARNALGAQAELPQLYWHGRTDMACLRDAVQQTLQHGYAHHIQRLMITGLYALLRGVQPQQVHAWYLAVYVDAVEWVELPNTLGMSQYADGGQMASKPYIASGKYIEKMSAGSLCARCRFKPEQRTGPEACPFTTLYWDFLMRHEALLARNPRLGLQVKALGRLSAGERAAVQQQAALHRLAEP